MKLDAITREIHKTLLKTKKSSPHIFFGAGIIGSVVSTVLACRATLKLEGVLEEIQQDAQVARSDLTTDPEYQARAYRRAVVRGLVKIGKLYGPTVLVEAASIAALSGSHVQLTKRNGALVATLVAVTNGFDGYRERVSEEVGEENEQVIYFEGCLVDKSDWNALTRIFDEQVPSYHKDVEMNRNFLHFCQREANRQLQKQGVVFLNDVYDMLGFEKSREGYMYGWVYGGDGMNEIDFGLFEAYNSRFINGLERAVILTFNVDGVLHEYM